MSKENSTSDLFELPGDDVEPSSSTDRLLRTLDSYLFAPARVASTDWRMWVGTTIIVFFILVGTVGVRLVPEPTLNQAAPWTGAFVDWSVPFGTDRLGRSIGKQLVHATPAMLKMALAGAVVSTGIAVLIGTAAGYKGGRVDDVLMTVTDVVMTIPALPLVIVLAAIFKPKDPFVVGMILAIDNWPGLARALRSQVLTIRDESYVEAARVMGIPSPTILRRDIVPQMMPYILVNSATSARSVIVESVALTFLGLLTSSTYNWGVMMNDAYQAGAMANLERAGHWLYAPMVMLVLFSLGLILFSQGMDRIFNPQLRARHAKTVGGDDEAEATSIANP